MMYVRNQWDRVLAWLFVTVGALALILGWIGVTGTPYTFEMIPYVLSGGLGGLFLLGVGAMLWLSADLRDEWRTLHDLLDQHAAASTEPVEATERLGARNAAAGTAATPVSVQTGDTAPGAVPASAAQRSTRATASQNGQGRPRRVSK